MKRRAQDPNPYQAAIDFTSPQPASVAEEAAPIVPEPETASPESRNDTPPEYNVTDGWIDMAGKKRTWRLNEPSGAKLAEVTTKSGAQKIAELLNRAEGIQRGRSK